MMLITHSTIWFVNSYKESVGLLFGIGTSWTETHTHKHSTGWSQRGDLDPPKVQIHSLFFEELQWWFRHQSASFWWTEICIVEGSLDVICSLQPCNTAFLDELSRIFSCLIIGPHSPNTWDAANIDLHLHRAQSQLVNTSIKYTGIITVAS